MVNKIVVTVIIEPDDDRFHAYCPGLPGIHIDGETSDEAFKRTRPAIELYLDSMRNHGEEIVSREGLKVVNVKDDAAVVREAEFEYAIDG